MAHYKRGSQGLVILALLSGVIFWLTAQANAVISKTDLTLSHANLPHRIDYTPVMSSCIVSQITDTAGGSDQPMLNKAGDLLAFWSTANLDPTKGNSDGNVELFLYDVKAKKFIQVTNTLGTIVHGRTVAPAINSQGTQIVFVSDQDFSAQPRANPDKNFEVFLAQAVTSTGQVTITQVTNTADDANLSPSLADNGMIAFNRTLNGQIPPTVTPTPSPTVKPPVFHDVFLPILLKGFAGRTITLQQAVPINYQLYLYDPSQHALPLSGVTGLMAGFTGEFEVSPLLNPAATVLLFMSNQDLVGQNSQQVQQIFVYNLAAKTTTQVTHLAETGLESMSMNGDGSRIAFIYKHQLYLTILQNNGTYTERILTPDTETASLPAMSGDGTRIAFTSDRDGNPELYIYEITADLYLQVTNLPAELSRVSNQASINVDGTYVAFGSGQQGNREIYLAYCPIADLSVQKTAAASVLAGNTLNYTFTVKNNSSDMQALAVVVSDTLPSGVEFVSGANCSNVEQLVRCQVGNLNPQSQTTLSLQTRVQPGSRGTLLNLAEVKSGSTDRNLVNNQASATTIIEPSAKLVISGLWPGLVLSTEQISYNITISNEGPSTANNVHFMDTLPLNGQLVNFSTFNCPTTNGTTINCNLTQFTPGQTATFTLLTDPIPVGTSGLITNVVTLSSDEAIVTANEATEVLDVTSGLHVFISDDQPDPVAYQDQLRYTISILNASNEAATDVILINTLSPDVTFLAANNCGRSDITFDNTTHTWQIGTLAPRERLYCLLYVKVTTAAVTSMYQHEAEIRGFIGNSFSNNVDSEQTQLASDRDLTVQQTNYVSAVYPEQQLTYVLTLTNLGAVTVNNVVLRDSLPAATHFVFATGAPTQQGNDLVWSLPTVPPYAVLNYTVVLTVSKLPTLPTTLPATITNLVKVSATGDPNPTNNNATDIDAIAGMVSGLAWHDLDGDGNHDGNETQVATGLMTVTLQDLASDRSYLITTTNGVYTFTDLLAGQYQLSFSKPPSGYDQFGAQVTNTLTLYPGTVLTGQDVGAYRYASLGDVVWHDLNGDGVQQVGEAGLSDVTVEVYQDSTNQLIGSATTAAGGLFKIGQLAPGNYYLRFLKPIGYDAFSLYGNSVDDTKDSDYNAAILRTAKIGLTSGMNDTTWDAGVYKYITIGDFVWNDVDNDGIQDPAETGRSNVDVELNGRLYGSSTINYITTASTNANGFYLFQNLTPGYYYVHFSRPAGHLLSPSGQASSPDSVTGNTIEFATVSGQNYLSSDAGVYQSTNATVGDFVWLDANANGVQDAGEPGLDNITVQLLDDSNEPIFSTVTANGGLYSFADLFPNSYAIQVINPDPFQYQFTLQGQGTTATDSNVDPQTGQTSAIILTQGQIDTRWDAGFTVITTPVTTNSIAGRVWYDVNYNGLRDTGELPLADVSVSLVNVNATFFSVISSTRTDNNGIYLFSPLPAAGNYMVIFSSNVYDGVGPKDVGGDDTKDNDTAPGTYQAQTDVFVVGGAATQFNYDAGLYALATIGDLVWDDFSANGLQTSGEPGIPNTTVRLYDASTNSVIATDITDANGIYSFKVKPGTYYVECTVALSFQFVAKNVSGGFLSFFFDSDVYPNGPNYGKTDPFTIDEGQTRNDLDCGMQLIPPA